jgi:hypothetical protein
MRVCAVAAKVCSLARLDSAARGYAAPNAPAFPKRLAKRLGAELAAQLIEVVKRSVGQHHGLAYRLRVRADALEIDFSPTGPATATIKLITQGSTRSGSSSGGTPVSATYTAFHKAQGPTLALALR